MRKSIIVFVLAAVVAFAADARAITMNWSYVGNAGNAPDPATGSLYGAVPYNYNIGTYDVTNNQYVAFLNSNDPTGANMSGLYNIYMSYTPYGGINYNSVAANGSMYSVIPGYSNNPVTEVSFADAIRFANWMNNGQVPGSTETGAYTLSSSPITRNAGATVFLTSENEWYKAAYYNPTTSSYYQYPTSSNTAPNASGPTATSNSANYENVVGYPTAVGVYSGTTSPYGAYDMGGNVWQWDEAVIDQYGDRGVRGGSFDNVPSDLLSSRRNGIDGTAYDVGFRLASIPEPSTLTLAAFGLAGLAAWGWRRRKRSHA